MAEEPLRKLITIEATTKEFEANGKKYTIESQISADRYSFYLRESIKFSFGQSVEQLFQAFAEIYNCTNNPKKGLGDIAVISRDAMKGIEGIVKRVEDPVALRLCCLFINREDEDRRYIDEDLITSKIDDWKKEGIDMTSFFQFASATIAGLKTLFEESSRIISQSPMSQTS
jgi:hypothetical protein